MRYFTVLLVFSTILFNCALSDELDAIKSAYEKFDYKIDKSTPQLLIGLKLLVAFMKLFEVIFKEMVEMYINFIRVKESLYAIYD